MEGGPPSFPQTHRGSWYSGIQPGGLRLSLRDSHPLWCRFPTASSQQLLLYVSDPTTPLCSKTQRFGLFPSRSPLLRESRLMSSRRATEMFQFARGPPRCLCIQQWVSRHDSGWVAPFGFSGLTARMQLPLNVSPVSASFVGLQHRGIHLVLSLACLTIRSLTTPHTLLACLAWPRLQTTHSKLYSVLSVLLVRFLPSAKLK